MSKFIKIAFHLFLLGVGFTINGTAMDLCEGALNSKKTTASPKKQPTCCLDDKVQQEITRQTQQYNKIFSFPTAEDLNPFFTGTSNLGYVDPLRAEITEHVKVFKTIFSQQGMMLCKSFIEDLKAPVKEQVLLRAEHQDLEEDISELFKDYSVLLNISSNETSSRDVSEGMMEINKVFYTVDSSVYMLNSNRYEKQKSAMLAMFGEVYEFYKAMEKKIPFLQKQIDEAMTIELASMAEQMEEPIFNRSPSILRQPKTAVQNSLVLIDLLYSFVEKYKTFMQDIFRERAAFCAMLDKYYGDNKIILNFINTIDNHSFVRDKFSELEENKSVKRKIPVLDLDFAIKKEMKLSDSPRHEVRSAFQRDVKSSHSPRNASSSPARRKTSLPEHGVKVTSSQELLKKESSKGERKRSSLSSTPRDEDNPFNQELKVSSSSKDESGTSPGKEKHHHKAMFNWKWRSSNSSEK